MTTLETELEIKNDEEMGVESDTFIPTGKRFGLGAWGVVDEYTDPAGQSWALKSFSPNEIARRQMEERGWTEEDVMRREAIPLGGAEHNAIPRIIERDKKGKLFVAMPVYSGGTLESRMREITHAYKTTRSLGNIVNILINISDALGFLHSLKNNFFVRDAREQSHGDVKPANILMSWDGKAYLGDFGSTTCISAGGRGSLRGVHGDRNYRAPECSQEDSRPSTRADIWSLGAIGYELISGEGIYSGIERLSGEDLQKAVDRKLKKVPRKMRRFLRHCLAVNPEERESHGLNARHSLLEIKSRLSSWNVFKSYAKKAGLITLGLGIPALLAYGIVTHHAPERDLRFKGSNAPAMIVKPGTLVDKSYSFNFESIDGLPEVRESGIFDAGKLKYIRRAAANPTSAYLLRAYGQAQSRGCDGLGFFDKKPEQITDYQKNLYEIVLSKSERDSKDHLGPVWPVWSMSIETALDSAPKNPAGEIDLEDVLVASRLGWSRVREAKRNAGSEEYRAYREQLPKEEREFINTWAAYYHADIDF